MSGERFSPSRRATETPARRRELAALERDDAFDDLHVGQRHEACSPVERGRAREVLQGQCAHAVIEFAQFTRTGREPNVAEDRDGLVAEYSGEISRGHERMQLSARGAV